MALFSFDLHPVAAIEPWGLPDRPKLSWFALTLGDFRVHGDDALLFHEPDYQVAAYVRGVLATRAAATSRLPARFEALVSDWPRLDALYERTWSAQSDIDTELAYVAWRWLGERQPDFPETMSFIRVEDVVLVKDRERPGTSRSLPVDRYEAECRDVEARLMAAMSARIEAIEAGAQTLTPVSLDALREQHEGWRAEWASYEARAYEPDIAWDEAEGALRAIAEQLAIDLPLK